MNILDRLLGRLGREFSSVRSGVGSVGSVSGIRHVPRDAWFDPPALTGDQRDVADRFSDMMYSISDARNRRSYVCHWLGHEMLKWPSDLWMYQELLCRIQPDVILETGTHKGGSALYLACICDFIGKGRIVTVDLDETWKAERPGHPRITYLTGSSTSPEVVALMTEASRAAEKTFVILDSDHRMPHVLDEMRIYGPLVSPDSYMIVEDTIVNGHPSYPDFGPGPFEAVQAYLAESDSFEVDPTCERVYLTQNPRGFLRRKSS